MIETNIHAFLAAARSYLLELMPLQTPALATIPVDTHHR